MANRELKVQLSIEDRKLIAGLQKSLAKAKQETMQATQQMKHSWANYKMAIAGTVAAIGGVAYAIKEMVQAYAVQEKAELDLAAAMKISGTYTRQRWEEYKRFASEMQALTTFGDEAILQSMQNLATYGIKNEEVMKKATKAVLDLAAAKGIDLRTASEIVGKAFTGETGTLTRYGIVIEKGLDKTEKFDAVLNKITETMGGRATAATKTLAGEIQQLLNLMGDAAEKGGHFAVNLGNLLAQGFYKLTGMKGDLKTFVQDWLAGMDIINKKMEEWTGRANKVDELTSSIKTQSRALQEYKATVEDIQGLDMSSQKNLFKDLVNQFQLPSLENDKFILEIQTQEQYLNSLRQTWLDTIEDISDAMGGWDNIMAQFGGNIAGDLFDLAYAHELTADAIVQSMAKLAAGVIKNITQQAAVKAVWELAEAWANYALGNAAAGAMHLKAAGLYGAVAGAGIVAGGILGSVASGESKSNARTGAVGGGVVIDTIHSAGTVRPMEPQQPLTIVNVVDRNSFLGLMASEEGKNIVINTVSLDYGKNGAIRRIIKGGA